MLEQADVSPRDFVSTYWPNPGTLGAQVRSMYDRLAAIDSAPSAQDPPSGPELHKSNGQANGLVVKQE